MKILFLFTYNKGLLSNFFMDLGQQLCEDNHEVKVFSLKENPKKVWVGNIEIITEAKGGYLSNYYRIFKYFKKSSPDVIISSFSYDNPALLAGKLLKIKRKIVWAHSLKKHGNPGPFRILLKRHFYKFADRVIVNSTLLEDELRQVYKVEKPKITAIPFWSNISKLSSSPVKVEKRADKILIGCPGRFTIIKNQIVIIEAVLALQDKMREKVEVYFAGDGPTRSEIERKVNDYDLGEKVSFLGVLSAGQIKDFYEKMDIIVLPSLFESFGLVFIETISLGIPVLVSKKFGALDFVRKESEAIKQIIFDPEDPEQLARKIEGLATEGKSVQDFFQKIYTDHFNKNLIYRQIVKILN